MARAVSVQELLTKKRKLLDFEGPWAELIGHPELSGAWIIWGGSTSGKTSFSLQLAKYLTQFERVLYNSLEEGDSESMGLAFQRTGMLEVAKRITLLDCESIAGLTERLAKHKSHNVIIIDSLQYTGLDFKGYTKLKELFPKKLFIFISHADGKEPEGKVAKKIRYDANVKIFVQGFRAYCNSRYGGGNPYVIWAKGITTCWGAEEELTNNNQNED